jgi:hypothetical protein
MQAYNPHNLLISYSFTLLHLHYLYFLSPFTVSCQKSILRYCVLFIPTTGLSHLFRLYYLCKPLALVFLTTTLSKRQKGTRHDYNETHLAGPCYPPLSAVTDRRISPLLAPRNRVELYTPVRRSSSWFEACKLLNSLLTIVEASAL